MAHPQRDAAYDRENFVRIAPDVKLGKNVGIFCHVNLYGCAIGDETKIGPFVEIQRGASIGKRCKIQSHSFICDAVTVEDECFIGHGVTFINDRYPAAVHPNGSIIQGGEWECVPTLIRKRASIGSNCVILCGVTIGEGALIGAGSVVTKNVPPGVVLAGNPARVLRRVDEPPKKKISPQRTRSSQRKTKK
jgi:UDP-2-acetamido-3-amino-2,3-dideoxy-glucuronate N-acetyltransferase